MAFSFHSDKKVYFDQQTTNAEHHVIPFIEHHLTIGKDTRVLEIGCGEGGVLLAFAKKGAQCVGVELSDYRVEFAESFLAEQIRQGRIEIICANIFDVDFSGRFKAFFDLIVLKDVIEHIHGQEALIQKLQHFLRPSGMIFFGFPPWQMPFGGHQQIAASKIASKLPFYHLLPMPLYRSMLKGFGEKPVTIEALAEIKETGISLERFERIIRRTGYLILQKQLFLINPIYQYKFGIKPRKQIPILGSIPILRNFINTAGFYLIRQK